ncbi:Pre-mRNA-splicing factor cwf19 [Coniosporium tulheliwenetii]|uniref:Pre-mRNA-splicing factor cwf19 n=1 Tax=Coniosporium tulheliwenetii TaxID=3383036 RepID=A0ACC2ZJZ2_9PEZI|nr:Pre-mRNA-splicing factor cwf19 [Cladosporium sp. JES 115]
MGLEDFERELAQSRRKRTVGSAIEVVAPIVTNVVESITTAHRDTTRTGRMKTKGTNTGTRATAGLKESVARDAEKDDDDDDDDEWIEKEAMAPPITEETLDKQLEDATESDLKRDSWMEAPSTLDVDYAQATRDDYELRVHKNELNHHLRDIQKDTVEEAIADEPAQHEVDYEFGDAGSAWRMTKLKAVYRQAEESGRPVEEIALERYGDLRDFDDAREEEIELDRRKMYGKDYVGKIKPSGELFQERKLNMGIRRESRSHPDNKEAPPPQQGAIMDEKPPPAKTVPLDQTALNKLKAQMMKAKLRDAPDAAELEAKYNLAMSEAANRREPEVVVLGAMENRMLAGGRKGEVKAIENTRGRERGLVEENEDMTIEDMVRQERRTRGQAGGDGLVFAERIAKDVKFDNDLEYMDDNATKLAKRVEKSEINLRNTAISDFQKMNRILDTCPLCHHEDTNKPPLAPIVSLATRVYMTLPTEPEISEGGACIVPIQHRLNLLECDPDEWEEIRNFMKCLTRMYHDQGRDVIFYENAAHPQRKRHAALEVVPLPYSLGETAPAFFREAILSADEEWTQHKKLIDTLARARDGLGKQAFQRTLAKEMPYFHVWFELDGGLGHIVEDSNRWPKGDLFAREIIGGMLDAEPDVIKRQGRWNKNDERVGGFKKRWRKFDWTRVLTDAQ